MPLPSPTLTYRPESSVRVRDFLDAVFGGVRGFLDIRTLPDVARAFVPVGDIDTLRAFVEPRRGSNVYLGAAVRVSTRDGTLANCSALPALFADIDFKSFPDEASARQRLAAAPVPPSVIVNSGGGLHGWWVLERLDLQQDATAAAKTLLLLSLPWRCTPIWLRRSPPTSCACPTRATGNTPRRGRCAWRFLSRRDAMR